jgi:hypothetical protein
MCTARLKNVGVWQKVYKESMNIENLTRVTSHLRNIIKILEKTHQTYLETWTRPNTVYCNVIGDIYIELLDNFADKL